MISVGVLQGQDVGGKEAGKELSVEAAVVLISYVFNSLPWSFSFIRTFSSSSIQLTLHQT